MEEQEENDRKSYLEKLAECVVCRQLEGPPKTLKCGHAVCLACVRKLFAKEKQKASYSGKKAKAIKVACPTCSQLTKVPKGKVDSLPTNVALLQMQKTIKELDQRAVFYTCRTLDKNLPEEYCRDCRKYMCAACTVSHLRRPNSASHTVVSARLVACRQHEQAEFHYFCGQCPAFLCDECVQCGTCKDHEFTDLSDIPESDVVSELEELMKRIKDEVVYNLEEQKPMIKNIQRKIDAVQVTKDVIRSRTQALMELLRKEEEKLIEQVEKRETELENMLTTLKREDKLEVFHELQKGAEEAMEVGEKKQMLMAVSALRARLPCPPARMPEERVCIYVKFRPELTARVGDVYQYFDAPRVLWEKGDLGWGQDVTFTPTGCLGVVDYSRTKVLLFDKFGEIIADSSELGVEFVYPSSIIYHPDEDALLVCDYKAGVVKFLDSHSLEMRSQVELENVGRPYGLAVLNNGFLVATQIGVDQKTSIHDVSGRLVKEWRTYGEENREKKINYPWYVAVDSRDNILVSMDTPDIPGKKRHIAVYSNAGRFLKTVTVPEGAPWGLCGDDRGNILVTSFPNTLYHYTGDEMKILEYKTVCGNIRSIALQGTRIALMYNHGLQLCLFRPE